MEHRIPVQLEALKCQSDGSTTKFRIARNEDTGTTYGKPARNVHIVPHEIFHTQVSAHMQEHFDVPECDLSLPRTGARMTMLFVPNGDQWVFQVGEKSYRVCVFAMNAYDGQTKPILMAGVWKNARQFSGSPCISKVKMASHTPAKTTTLVAESLAEFTPKLLEGFMAVNAKVLNDYQAAADIGLDDVFTTLQYNHIMISKTQKEELAALWEKVPSPVTELAVWNAVTYVLSNGTNHIEACCRFGKVHLKP